jgi:hypothetical protein
LMPFMGVPDGDVNGFLLRQIFFLMLHPKGHFDR